MTETSWVLRTEHVHEEQFPPSDLLRLLVVGKLGLVHFFKVRPQEP